MGRDQHWRGRRARRNAEHRGAMPGHFQVHAARRSGRASSRRKLRPSARVAGLTGICRRSAQGACALPRRGVCGGLRVARGLQPRGGARLGCSRGACARGGGYTSGTSDCSQQKGRQQLGPFRPDPATGRARHQHATLTASVQALPKCVVQLRGAICVGRRELSRQDRFRVVVTHLAARDELVTQRCARRHGEGLFVGATTG